LILINIKTKTMKKIVFSLIAISTLLFSSAQDVNEMVNNGSFEQLEGKIKKAGSIQVAVSWVSPTKTQADLFSSKVKEGYSVPNNPKGKEDAYDGDNYVGIKTFSYGDKEARTYISSKLKTPMRKDFKYCVKFYVSLAEGSKYAADNIAANFSKKQWSIQEDKSIMGESHVMDVNNKIFNAQFGWDQICGVYTATGGERFITIGNFTSNGDTESERMKPPKGYSGQLMISSYYYLDNISVKLIEDESECDCKTDSEEETSIVYAVSPVTPDGMKDELIAKYSVVYFGSKKADIAPGDLGHLDNIVSVMKKDAAYKLNLVVHLDADEAADESLSGLDKQRALAIKKYIVSKGIDGARITFEMVKDTKPASTADTPIGKAKNRKVNFVISK
jgi:outer membrane protein OmpA-like peptidoglycan-associated protein